MKKTTKPIIVPQAHEEYFIKQFQRLTKELLNLTVDPVPHDPEIYNKDLEEIRRIQETTRNFFQETSGNKVIFQRGKTTALIGKTKHNKLLLLQWQDHGGGLLTHIESKKIPCQIPQERIKEFEDWICKNLKISYKGEITIKPPKNERETPEKEPL